MSTDSTDSTESTKSTESSKSSKSSKSKEPLQVSVFETFQFVASTPPDWIQIRSKFGDQHECKFLIGEQHLSTRKWQGVVLLQRGTIGGSEPLPTRFLLQMLKFPMVAIDWTEFVNRAQTIEKNLSAITLGRVPMAFVQEYAQSLIPSSSTEPECESESKSKSRSEPSSTVPAVSVGPIGPDLTFSTLSASVKALTEQVKDLQDLRQQLEDLRNEVSELRNDQQGNGSGGSGFAFTRDNYNTWEPENPAHGFRDFSFRARPSVSTNSQTLDHIGFTGSVVPFTVLQ